MEGGGKAIILCSHYSGDVLCVEMLILVQVSCNLITMRNAEYYYDVIHYKYNSDLMIFIHVMPLVFYKHVIGCL